MYRSQPGDQPEDTLYVSENAKPKLFGQLLAQQISSNHSTDPADGVEPVESLQLAASLSRNVIIGENKKSLKAGKKISGRKCNMDTWTQA